MERHCDVLVVGGSAAGLAAALQLVRQRRSVIVVDTGEPRNAPAAHMHGFLGRDGSPPDELLVAGREEVRSYGGEVVAGRVVRLDRADDGHLRAELTGGHAVVARRVVAATGITDRLPPIDGVAEQWGRGVIHCPFCHGYEVRDRRVVHIISRAMHLHPALLFRQLTADLTLVIHDPAEVDEAELDRFRVAGVRIVTGPVRRVVSDATGSIDAVEMTDGLRLPADAVAIGTEFSANAAPFASIGLSTVAHASGLGDVVEVDPTGATSVDGLFAAGNLVDPMLQVVAAAADGSKVGAMVAMSLAADDLRAGARQRSGETDWDHRYSGERIWSGNPNGALVAETSDMAPGRALDVGAGEGGDAIWLADRGWAVTANDISGQALRRIADEAHRRGLGVDGIHADANELDPFPGATFDLVTAHYASIPRTPDDRGARNLVSAVAPGGTLLMVQHDPEAMRRPVDTRSNSRAFDGDAFLRVDDVAAILRDDPEWTIEVAETRPRPPGAASASHHVDDVVLRARRADPD